MNTLPDYSDLEGESLVTDLMQTLSHHITFQEMVAIVASNTTPATITRLQAPPRQKNNESALVNTVDDLFAQMVSEKKMINCLRVCLSRPSYRSSLAVWHQPGTMWMWETMHSFHSLLHRLDCQPGEGHEGQVGEDDCGHV